MLARGPLAQHELAAGQELVLGPRGAHTKEGGESHGCGQAPGEATLHVFRLSVVSSASGA